MVKVPEDVSAALAAFKGDRNDFKEKYIVLGYQDKNTLCVVASEEDSPFPLSDKIVPHLPGDKQRYVVIRIPYQVEMAKTVKFGYIDWTPSTLKPMRKAMLSTHKGKVGDLLKPYHVSLQASDVADISEEELMNKFGFASGVKSHVTEKKAKKFIPLRSTQQTQSNNAPRENKQHAVTASRALGFADGSQEQLEDHIRRIRLDSDPTDWCVIGYANPKTLEFLEGGTGGLEAMRAKMAADETRMYYGFFRTTEQFDKTTTVKFCFVKMICNTMSPVALAKYATHMGFVHGLFEPYHEEFLADNVAHFTAEVVAEQIQSTMGTRSKVLSKDEGARRIAAQEEKKNTKTRRSSLVATESHTEIKWTDDEEWEEAIAKVRSDNEEETWVTVAYQGKDTLDVLATGAGGVDDLVETFEEDQICFALLRVTDQVDKSTTVKFVYIKWQPSTISPVTKSYVSTLKGTINPLFRPFHVDFFIEDASEISDDLVLQKVQETSGTRSMVRAKVAE